MANSKLLGGAILGAAVTLALYKLYSMTEDERAELVDHIKETTSGLLDDAEKTIEKIESYMSEIKDKGEGEWIDKMHVVKRMLGDFYGREASNKSLGYK
ncbi:MAG: hypothetical protein ABIT96_01550 [Ferruginibacter sp.]